MGNSNIWGNNFNKTLMTKIISQKKFPILNFSARSQQDSSLHHRENLIWTYGKSESFDVPLRGQQEVVGGAKPLFISFLHYLLYIHTNSFITFAEFRSSFFIAASSGRGSPLGCRAEIRTRGRHATNWAMPQEGGGAGGRWMNIPRQAKTRVMEDMLNSWQPEPRNTESSIPFLHTRDLES
jgi:hypothetical protein